MIPNYRNYFKFMSFLLLTMFLSTVLVVAAPLETVTNTNDAGPGSLRQALVDVDNNGVIVFDLPGAGPHTIFVLSTLLIDKSLTLTGPGANLLTVDGTSGDTIVFQVNNGVPEQSVVQISGITVDGGLTAINGIFNRDILTINDLIVTGTRDGLVAAGQFSVGALLTINDSRLTGNTQAGIFIFGALNPGSEGSLVEINRTTISNNDVFGIINFATQQDSAESSTVIINKSTLSDQPIAILNTGGNAPGVTGGVVEMRNSTMSNHSNVAFFNGGPGVDGALGPVVRISSSTIAGNNAGLIYNDTNINVLTMEIKNSIIGDNQTNCAVVGDGLTSLGGNLDTDGSCLGFTQVTPAALNLGPLQNNGGPTDTHALILPSVAIDSVSDCTFINGSQVLEDQREFFRPPVNCDAGAFELEGINPQIRNVPTLSEWGVIVMVILFGIIAFLFNRRIYQITL